MCSCFPAAFRLPPFASGGGEGGRRGGGGRGGRGRGGGGRGGWGGRRRGGGERGGGGRGGGRGRERGRGKREEGGRGRGGGGKGKRGGGEKGEGGRRGREGGGGGGGGGERERGREEGEGGGRGEGWGERDQRRPMSRRTVERLAVLFPPQVSASLAVRLSEGYSHRTTTGFPCFALLRCDRCRRLLYSGTVVLSRLPSGFQPPPPPPSGGSFSPVPLPPSRVLANEACRGSLSFTLPAFPLPVTSGWNTGPWAFSRASHPAVASDACQERERALSTRPELTVDQSTLHFSYLTQTVRPHVAPRSASNPKSPPHRHHLHPGRRQLRPRAARIAGTVAGTACRCEVPAASSPAPAAAGRIPPADSFATSIPAATS